MQEGDGHALETLGPGGGEVTGQGALVQRRDDRAVGGQALVRLDHAGMEGKRLDDIEGEEFGPGLVADGQGVGETRRSHQQGARAGALEKGVGGHRCADANRVDPVGRERLAGTQLQQAAHGLHGGVGIGG